MEVVTACIGSVPAGATAQDSRAAASQATGRRATQCRSGRIPVQRRTYWSGPHCLELRPGCGSLDVQSRHVVIRGATHGGTRYGPSSPRQRHHDSGGASRDTAEPREREGAGPAARHQAVKVGTRPVGQCRMTARKRLHSVCLSRARHRQVRRLRRPATRLRDLTAARGREFGIGAVDAVLRASPSVEVRT
jgi:hypothetical protein